VKLIPQIVAANHHTAEVAFGLGIDTVIYETLPAASFFPVTPTEVEAAGDAAIAAVNAGLVADAQAWQQQGFDVRVVDTAAWQRDLPAMRDHFKTFGDKFPQGLWDEFADLERRLSGA